MPGRVFDIEILANELRRRTLSTILAAETGHSGGSSSSVELMAGLYYDGALRFDPSEPGHPERDRVLVRGHLGPLRYSLFSMLGWIEPDLLQTYRRFGSPLQGHEVMGLIPGVDITPSGSLGMLLSFGAGCAYAKRASK